MNVWYTRNASLACCNVRPFMPLTPYDDVQQKVRAHSVLSPDAYLLVFIKQQLYCA